MSLCANVLQTFFHMAIAPKSHPFQLCNVTFCCDNKVFGAFSTPLAELISANHVALTFTTQKNGIKGEAYLANSGLDGTSPMASGPWGEQIKMMVGEFGPALKEMGLVK